MIKTNLQVVIEKQRSVYEVAGIPPFLQQLCMVHGVSIREFADIFGISKSHAEDLLKHRTFPSLELGIRISRYFETNIEELFGWRVDDDGARRPLLICVPGTTKVITLKANENHHQAIALVRDKIQMHRLRVEKKLEEKPVPE